MPPVKKSQPPTSKKPSPKRSSGRKKASRSVVPYLMAPLIFVAATAAILFGANCRQNQGTIGTAERPIGAVVTPRANATGVARTEAPPPGPGNRPPGPRPKRTDSAPPPAPQNPGQEQMLLGNPDQATVAVANREHFLMARPEFALSYNDTLRFPNWVAWHLSRSDIGDTERGQFVPDPDLPGDFTRIFTSDYTRSGYDRGHNCPSKDRSASRAINDVAFYMTNITPQRHEMNAGPWEKLESYCRELAESGNELYIVCGHGFKGDRRRTFGPKRIAIPDFGWKIAVVLPERDGDDRERIERNTRVIAIMVPNVKGISKQKWAKYIVTVGEIEQATGLRFFDALPPDVADALKTKRDGGEEDGR
ncbi:MAG: DNA/RNA non-specific endonuclease [Capsulimonadales bacterium]|nr:DNA/RNA non-specific endonuclease [Capsulimonadales bacterium]